MELLADTYRVCSMYPSPTPNQSQALANAAALLGSRGAYVGLIRAALNDLRAAFELS